MLAACAAWAIWLDDPMGELSGASAGSMYDVAIGNQRAGYCSSTVRIEHDTVMLARARRCLRQTSRSNGGSQANGRAPALGQALGEWKTIPSSGVWHSASRTSNRVDIAPERHTQRHGLRIWGSLTAFPERLTNQSVKFGERFGGIWRCAEATMPAARRLPMFIRERCDQAHAAIRDLDANAISGERVITAMRWKCHLVRLRDGLRVRYTVTLVAPGMTLGNPRQTTIRKHTIGEGTMAEKSERSTSEQLPEDVGVALVVRGIEARDAVTLRQALEKHLKGYTLYRLTPAAARRWKCQYRIMFAATYFDCQTVAEAYARALLASLPAAG